MQILTNTAFSTNFVVMPEHTNYKTPLIFGGAFFSQMDLCAAITVNRFLKTNSKVAHGGVTHKASVTYHKPCYLGDLIYLTGEIYSWNKKSILVKVKCVRETRLSLKQDLVAEGEFVFVAIQDVSTLENHPEFLPYVNHGV